MRLFYSPASPYVRKVMMVLAETGLTDQVQLVAAGGTPLDPGTTPVDHNPLGKIPTLVTEDGKSLFDSRVITRYLDARANAGLYPQGDAIWDTLTLEALADGIADAALLMAYETRLRPENMYFADWVEGQWSKVARALRALEANWMPALNGPFGIGHIAVLAALGYVDFRHGARNWRAEFPTLAAWEAEHAARPSVAATVAPKA